MGSVTLHKTKGVNPYLTYCPRCGGDAPDLILVGSRDWLSECENCKTKMVGALGFDNCPKCARRTHFTRVRDLKDREKLPGGLCHECEAKDRACDEMVAAGGIYWRCKDCGSAGALKAETEYAKDVRAAHGVAAPTPIGVEFDKTNCPVCGPNPVAQQEASSGQETTSG